MSAAPTACLARAFKVRVLPGQEEAYERYLREAVEPVDAIALDAGVFAHMIAMRPEDTGACWTHARVFFFTSQAQRQCSTLATAKTVPG